MKKITKKISFLSRIERKKIGHKTFKYDKINKINPLTKYLRDYKVNYLNLYLYKDKYNFEIIENDDFRLIYHNSNSADSCIFQIHGGAFIIPLSVANIEASINYRNHFNLPVFSIDYTVSYDKPFPCALNECLSAFQYILSLGYKKIILVGNSAGGGLCLSLTALIIKKGLVKPFMIAIASPFANLEQNGESYSYNRSSDIIFGSKRKGEDNIIAIPTDYSNGDLRNPYVSPIYLNYKGFPPLIIQTGSDEMLLSDSITVYEMAKEANVASKLIIYKGMWHAFYSNNLKLRESKLAWREIINYYKSLL